MHATGTMASNSAVTDGERIYAHFGSRGLHCLDMNGKVLWSKEFPKMRIAGTFGEGCSPTLHGDFLVVPHDHEGESFVVTFDKKTGKELWRQDRDERTTWATPLVVAVDGKPQVIMPATKASRGYDLETGKELWSLSGMTGNVIPSPVYADGVVYLMSGFRSNALQAVRLAGAKGDLKESKNLEWSYMNNTSYVPSALLYQNHLYFLRFNTGVLTCLEASTGKVHYEGQKTGLRNVYSSPVGADSRVYVTSREGTTMVLKLGSTYEELATNQLDDVFDATAALVGDELYLRGQKSLYCIAEGE
jgi:outer membrane protein assembly factor BamB